jgi:hypothetical protein
LIFFFFFSLDKRPKYNIMREKKKGCFW